MKRRRTKWIPVVVVVVMVIAAVTTLYLASTRLTGVAQAEESATNTAAAELADITIYVSGTGSLVPVKETDLDFSESGTLLELLVDIGDTVKEGDLLAYLQTDIDRLELQSQIAAAELAVAEAQAAYDDLLKNADLAAAQALLDLEASEQAYEDVLSQDAEIAAAQQAVAAAQQAIEDAEFDLYLLNSKADENAIDTAYASLLFKEKALNEIEQEVETTEFKIRSANDNRMRESLKNRLLSLNVRLANTRLEYEAALAKYESLFADPDPYEVAVAEAQLETAQLQLAEAQDELDTLLAGPAAAELLQAEVDLENAREAYDLTRDGTKNRELALAEVELAHAKAQLAVLRDEKSVIELYAPMDGVVTTIQYDLSEYIAGGTVLTIADVSQPLVEFYVDQSESANIAVGETADVVFDALPGRTYSGTIVSIDPALQESGFVYYFRGEILLDDPDAPAALPIGLQASVEMVSSVIEDALMVPVQAVQTDANGDTYVYFFAGGALERREVTIGIIEGSDVVIEDGLTEGDLVAIDNFENLGSQE